MPGTTLTLRLEGDVPLDLFAQSMLRFRQLVDALTQAVSGDAGIVWIVDDLAARNAEITIRGESAEEEDVLRVERAYATVGRALERHELIPYSPAVVDAARGLMSVLNGKITSMGFDTESERATVTSVAPDRSQAHCSAFGALEGQVETLRRRRLSFTLHDALTDQAVFCKLRSDQTELVRDAWGKRVVVEGWIKREPVNGRPVEIDPVERVTILPELVPGSYRRARAVAPADRGAPSVESAIRQLRDA